MHKMEEFDPKENAHKLAESFLEKGDAVGWFEALYSEASGDHEHVPWADLEPNRFLVEWAEGVGLNGNGRSALVVGCGLGDDAKYLYDLGFIVTAFDISKKAIEWAKKIHAKTDIEFAVVDLFDPPKEWDKAFQLVLEVYTIQALPLGLREKTIDAISSFVAENGEIVVVQRHRENNEEPEGLPWALSPKDLSRFEANGLKQVSRDEYFGDEEEPVKRFVVKYKPS
ncbi:MAG: class I SAM-dependent methyltransferase [Pyrinomonadaceae bacterium]|nr:class I SAM-dependent methyltransferase [Pyrinomonadaceae bacterium]